MDRDENFLREEISSKNYIIKTLPENISQINNSFYKYSFNQNIKQKVNAETRDGFVFQKSKKNKRFNTVNRLSRLNQNVLSSNKFEQLRVEDNVQETTNVEQYDDSPNNNPTRTTTKKLCFSEADSNLDNCNRPIRIANSQNYLMTHKIPTTVVNRKPENQDIYKTKKTVPGRKTYGESIRKTSNNIVIFGGNITNFSRYHKDIFNQKIEDRRARFKYFQGALSRNILKNHIEH